MSCEEFEPSGAVRIEPTAYFMTQKPPSELASAFPVYKTGPSLSRIWRQKKRFDGFTGEQLTFKPASPHST